MSFDRKIDQVCDHTVTEEALFFDPDRLTVKPLRPISNVHSVKVRLNGALDVPSVGVKTPALGKSSLPGPYNIKAGVNDTLIVSVDDKPNQIVTVNAGRVISAKTLADNLTHLVSGAFFSTTKKNQIQARSITSGRASRITFKDGSTLATTLGMTLNRVYRGQQVASSWSLITDPNTLSDRPLRLIVLDEPIDGTNDYVEVSYSTVRPECRRCGGSGVEHDWRFDAAGEVIQVQKSDLLIQELLKITYTVKGSNPFHGWYGTGLLEAIGKKMSDRGLVQNLIMSDIQDAFKRWQSIKKQQEENIGQDVSDEEFPFRLLAVNLESDSEDPTIIYVNSLVQNRSSQPIQITRGLQLPIPLDILGSTVQDALLQQNKKRSS